MKRDLDLVRRIAQTIEERGIPDVDNDQELEILLDDPWLLPEHLRLMIEAGLVDAIAARSGGPEPDSYHVIRLTWAGYEFLDASRDEANWVEAKSIARQAGGWTLQLTLQILTKIISSKMGL